MSRASLIVLFLLLCAGCVNRAATSAEARAQSNTDSHPLPRERAPVVPTVKGEDSEESEKKREVPAAFKGVDFKNFSYPISWRRRVVRLENGKREYEYDAGKGTEERGWFDLRDVGYADLTGDGVDEAVVNISWVGCGGSCDGGSNLFYVYTIQKGRPKLLWRIETGSLGYGCGLKSFEADAKGINIEVFKDCRLKGAALVNDPTRELEPGEPIFKFSAKMFTHLQFKYEAATFALKGREVFPNTREDLRGYSAAVRVGDE